MLYRLFTYIHTKIFATQPGAFARAFWRNLIPSLLGEGAVIAVSLGVYIVAIRMLGPTEFGRWSLVSSVGELLAILPLFGLAAASLVYLGRHTERLSVIIGTAVRAVAIACLAIFPIYIVLGPFIASRAGIELPVMMLGIGYAFALLWSQLFQSVFKGTGKFKLLSVFLVLSAATFAATTFLLLFYFSNDSFLSIAIGNIVRVAVLAFAGVWVFKRYLTYFRRETLSELVSYGSLSMVSVLLGFFSLGSIDNLMINHFLGTEQVGIYAAYYMVFGLLVGKVLGTALQVFLHLLSGESDIKSIFLKSIALLAPASVILFLGSFSVTWLSFAVYGEHFIFDAGMAVLVSASTTIYFLKSPFESILSSRGVAGMKYGPLIAIVLAVLNVLFNLIFIPLWGLYGAALGTGLSAAFALVLVIFLIRKNFS